MHDAPPFLRVSCEKELIFDSGGIQKPAKDIIQNFVHRNNFFSLLFLGLKPLLQYTENKMNYTFAVIKV